MANELRIYMDETGKSAQQIADDLSEILGRPYSAKTIQNYIGKRPPPKIVSAALGLPPSSDPSTPGNSPDAADQPGGSVPPGGPEGRRAEVPPKPLPDSKIAPTPLALQTIAKERIAALHVFAGASIATAVDADGFQNDRGVGGGVALVWKDKADPIAEAWVKWANEGNKFAQAFVRLLATGGSGGELLMGYAMLLGGTAYIMGHLPDNEATRFGFARYSKYRTVDVEPPAGSPAPGQAEQKGGAGRAGPRPVRAMGEDPAAARG